MADEHFKKQLISDYIKYTDHNQFVNDQKHGRIFWSKTCLAICLIFSLFALVPYGYGYFQKKDDIYKVEIVDNETKYRAHIDSLKNAINLLLKNQKSHESNSEATTATATTATTGTVTEGRSTTTATAKTKK